MAKNKKIFVSIISCVFVAVMVIVAFCVFTVHSVDAKYSLLETSTEKATAVKTQLDYYKGKNLLFIDLEEIKQKVEKDPYLEVTEIKKKLPNQIELSIRERIGVFSVEYQGKKYAVSEEGIVLSELSEGYDERQFVDISLYQLTINEVVIGDKISCDDDVRLQTALRLAKTARLTDCVSKMEVQKQPATKTEGYQTVLRFSTYSKVEIEVWDAESRGEEKTTLAFEAYDEAENDYIKSFNKITVLELDEGNRLVVQWARDN